VKVDVVVLTALPEERVAVERAIEPDSKSIFTYKGYSNYKIINLANGLTVAIAPVLEMGLIKAACRTSTMLRDIHPRLTILVGIAGCMKEVLKVRERNKHFLGDIVISKQIIDYSLEKMLDGKSLDRFNQLQSFEPFVRAAYDRSREDAWASALGERPDQHPDPPNVYVGDVFSGNVLLADEDEKRKLIARRPNAIAIEMEAAGVAAAIQELSHYKNFVMIKCFCDWGTKIKDDAWHDYCCRASASYLLYALQTIVPEVLANVAEQPESQLFSSQGAAVLRCFLGAQMTETPFLQKMAIHLFNKTIEEVVDLAKIVDAKKQYVSNIDQGSQFLMRAAPLFQEASKLYITSLDVVSKFWTDKKSARDVKKYIAAQAVGKDRKAVSRLFVCETPASAHAHKSVLDAHVVVFDNTFICSRAHYKNIIRQIAHDSSSEYFDREFSILYFEQDGKETRFFSGLDSKTFDLNIVRDPPGDRDVDCMAFIKIFDRLANLDRGAMDPETKVVKWAENHQYTPEWIPQLHSMFPETTSDVFHCVSLNISKVTYDQIKDKLAKIKYFIFKDTQSDSSSLSERYGIKNIWLVRRLPREEEPLIDPATKGKLYYSHSDKMRYLLIMQADSHHSLDSFLKDRDILAQRLELFRMLGGDVQRLMEELGIAAPVDFERHTPSHIYYELIEKLASFNFRRFDFIDDEMIEQIVNS
jgi:nucleoside phosphorylase